VRRYAAPPGFRRVGFRPIRRPIVAYVKGQAICVAMLVINMVILPLPVGHSSPNAYMIQVQWASKPILQPAGTFEGGSVVRPSND
jgi:hypothetical protein